MCFWKYINISFKKIAFLQAEKKRLKVTYLQEKPSKNSNFLALKTDY